ncbi:MAG: hypothetical protein OEV94_03090 [Deltaproteobacteria bacterium]|nr:hypothetical protein [Deltaproteobacteria bacterium]
MPNGFISARWPIYLFTCLSVFMAVSFTAQAQESIPPIESSVPEASTVEAKTFHWGLYLPSIETASTKPGAWGVTGILQWDTSPHTALRVFPQVVHGPYNMHDLGSNQLLVDGYGVAYWGLHAKWVYLFNGEADRKAWEGWQMALGLGYRDYPGLHLNVAIGSWDGFYGWQWESGIFATIGVKTVSGRLLARPTDKPVLVGVPFAPVHTGNHMTLGIGWMFR